jgi:hypothetical protein
MQGVKTTMLTGMMKTPGHLRRLMNAETTTKHSDLEQKHTGQVNFSLFKSLIATCWA